MKRLILCLGLLLVSIIANATDTITIVNGGQLNITGNAPVTSAGNGNPYNKTTDTFYLYCPYSGGIQPKAVLTLIASSNNPAGVTFDAQIIKDDFIISGRAEQNTNIELKRGAGKYIINVQKTGNGSGIYGAYILCETDNAASTWIQPELFNNSGVPLDITKSHIQQIVNDSVN